MYICTNYRLSKAKSHVLIPADNHANNKESGRYTFRIQQQLTIKK